MSLVKRETESDLPNFIFKIISKAYESYVTIYQINGNAKETEMTRLCMRGNSVVRDSNTLFLLLLR